ncbi:MAG: hypothetical protein DIZ80_16680 [endosymbiont of Galathealinum brachiosum]|uniref:Uncharacterized protein n=1 Tax=endosymbiont of Galathealinum brachiosum TaxID=2200906 RepID=A0A370D6L0_9GAMM|nr:MAG: hypothetical protein DIZ80_16680 [endosymbiont of Galathealinum brachiosum]
METMRGFNDMSAQHVAYAGNFKILGFAGTTTGNYTSQNRVTIRNESNQYCLVKVRWLAYPSTTSIKRFGPHDGFTWNRSNTGVELDSVCDNDKSVFNETI